MAGEIEIEQDDIGRFGLHHAQGFFAGAAVLALWPQEVMARWRRSPRQCGVRRPMMRIGVQPHESYIYSAISGNIVEFALIRKSLRGRWSVKVLPLLGPAWWR